MTLRALGVQPSFVVIAGLILAGLLLGCRAVCLLLRRIRTRGTAPAVP